MDFSVELAKQGMSYVSICGRLKTEFGYVTNDTALSYALRKWRNFRRDRSTISRLHIARVKEIQAEQRAASLLNPYMGKEGAMEDLRASMLREMANANQVG